MKKEDFERVDMRSPDYEETLQEFRRSAKLCHKINAAAPYSNEREEFTAELLPQKDKSSAITPPFQIDMGKNVRVGSNVFINHGLTVMARGGVEVADDVMIGPNVSLLTANHELDDHWILLCGKITIERNAWIGANVSILPGVTIGENSVVGTGSVVTRDVPANTVVAGNPARAIRKISMEKKSA